MRILGSSGSALVVAAVVLSAAALEAQAVPIHHHLDVRLNPAEHRLTVVDAVTLPNGSPRELTFMLHAGLKPTSLTPEVRIIKQAEKRGDEPLESYKVALPPGVRAVSVSYGGTIFHPVTHGDKELAGGMPSTLGIISTDGVHLSESSAWYPEFDAAMVTFDLEIKLPKAWDAVSQGVRTAHDRGPLATVVRWKSAEPQEGVFLIAAPFTEYDGPGGPVQAMVFLRTADAGLAKKYLDATGRYIAMYDKLIGPYPYKKFALVENFAETGFGMPSFTLLGPTVIRLPFIVHTSYPHEILHNWWGNGVYVDYAKGNWCEGLTSYLADHLLKEQRGEGVEYRVATLQNYTDYVRGNKDFPLTQFRSRHDPSTAAVGYGKSLMFFHILRRKLGDDVFQRGLREFYRKYEFRLATFDDIRTTMEAVSGKSLKRAFEQWVTRSGAPQLKVSEPSVRPEGSGFVLSAVLEQQQPGDAYRLGVPVAVTLEGRNTAVQETIEMDGKRKEVRLELPARPLRLDVDPEFDLFRRLDRDEIPPAISQALGAKRLLVVLPARAEERLLRAYRAFAQSLARSGPDKIETKLDAELAALPRDCAIMVLGWENRYAAKVLDSLSEYGFGADQQAVHIAKSTVPRKGHCFVLTTRRTENRDLALSFATADLPESLPGLAKKLPHYSKYSYLAFAGAQPAIEVKGRWPVLGSPLTIFLPVGDAPPKRIEMGRLEPRKPLIAPATVFPSHGRPSMK